MLKFFWEKDRVREKSIWREVSCDYTEGGWGSSHWKHWVEVRQLAPGRILGKEGHLSGRTRSCLVAWGGAHGQWGSVGKGKSGRRWVRSETGEKGRSCGVLQATVRIVLWIWTRWEPLKGCEQGSDMIWLTFDSITLTVDSPAWSQRPF